MREYDGGPLCRWMILHCYFLDGGTGFFYIIFSIGIVLIASAGFIDRITRYLVCYERRFCVHGWLSAIRSSL
jgi:hypothetical protein